MQDRFGSSDQGCMADDVPVLEPGVGEEEKRNSSPGLFQLAEDVPGGVGLDPLVATWLVAEFLVIVSPLCSNSISRLVRAID